MAKRKTPKTDKIIDLKPEKITDLELKKVQRLVGVMRATQTEIGLLEQRKHQTLHNLAGVQDEMTILQEEFVDKYGTNDIDINEGTINYPKENGETDKKD
jgi:hypothetical protein|tara:strand:+ start:1431 stop:1730 length:300 start_codon:yes stop_codon:yes gene_type:complete